jgi:glycosyltransferase involved in cell wall biosynthesis
MKNVLIISHANANSGAIDRLEDFLLRRKCKVFKITHPLDKYENGETILWEDGEKKRVIRRHQRSIFNLLIDLKLTTELSYKLQSRTIIGANNFDTCCAILAKKLSRKHGVKIIYFASDYAPNRFANNLMNSLYGRIERGAIAGSDNVISNTYRAESKRLELGLDARKGTVIYNTAYLPHPTFKEKTLNKNDFLYVGSLTQEHGIYRFLELCHAMIKRLTIIGDGPERDHILNLCNNKNIDVTYLGQKDHNSTIDFMQRFCGIGIAPYDANPSTYVYYGSSLKIYEYLACGLPVLTSNVTEQSELVKKYKLGIVYEKVSHKIISQEIEKFSLRGFNKKAEAFYKKYNQQELYQGIAL